jgi:hypothetical protein
MLVLSQITTHGMALFVAMALEKRTVMEHFFLRFVLFIFLQSQTRYFSRRKNTRQLGCIHGLIVGT